jgi:hypothetical protein
VSLVQHLIQAAIFSISSLIFAIVLQQMTQPAF